MKIFLTIFVLLSSSSVFAEDKLLGKKIFCKKITSTSISLIGFYFLKDNKSEVYYHNTKGPLKSRKLKYKTNLLTITIYEEDTSNTSGVDDTEDLWSINRKNLEFTFLVNADGNFEEKECELVNDLFISIFNNEIKKINEGNIL